MARGENRRRGARRFPGLTPFAAECRPSAGRRGSAAIRSGPLVIQGLCPSLPDVPSAEGPWTALATFTGGYCKTTKYFTAREGGGSQFERFIRWKLDRSDATLTTWKTCFRICAVLKE